MNEPIRYGDMIRRLADRINRLDPQGVPSALRSARRLTGFVTGASPAELIAREREIFPEALQTAFEQAAERLLAGEPLTRIIGKTCFYGYDFIVTPDVLDPRSDTELLIDTAKKYFPDPQAPLKILDIGAGSGCVTVTLAKEFVNSYVTGLDICEKALITANENAKANDVQQRCVFLQCDPLSYSEHHFDLIVSNPPYLTEVGARMCEISVRNYDPRLALVGGEDGLRLYRDFIPDFIKKLAPNGRFIVEFGIGQGRYIKELSESHGFAAVALVKDSSNLFRCVTGVKPI